MAAGGGVNVGFGIYFGINGGVTGTCLFILGSCGTCNPPETVHFFTAPPRLV
jgi:hypothetical protein